MKLELNIKVSELRNADFVGQSDPFCVVYVNHMASPVAPKRPPQLKHPNLANRVGVAIGAITKPIPSLPLPRGKPKLRERETPWEQLGRTETVPNRLEASFARPVKVSYFFERAQLVVVDVYDADGLSDNLMSHDYLGSAQFALSTLVRSKGQCLKLPLSMEAYPKRSCGFVTIIAEDKASRRNLVKMDVGLTIFKRPTILGHYGGPYLHIYRRASAPDDSWMAVYKSAAAGRRDRTQNAPRYNYFFDGIRENYERLCISRNDTQLRFEIRFLIRQREREYAAVEMSLAEWRSRGGVVELFHPGVAGRGEGARPKGTLTLRGFDIVEEPQFVDYIMGGCEISLVIGVDFTASNGDSMQPSSLHFCDMFRHNEYELAIRAVGDILAEYDTDNCFPTYGFGAKLPPNYERVSHCFALTGVNDPICHKVDGVLNAYRQTLYNVKLSGPTEFSQLIQTAARHAEAERVKYVQAYTILLIVTDGVINDYEETTRSIVDASHLPLSIVIIGVGTADFTAMNMLDGDEIPLSAMRCRDIVQFVPFSAYQNRPDMLVSKVLEEIPKQLVDYFTMKGIGPNPPIRLSNGADPQSQSTHHDNNSYQEASHHAAQQQTAPQQGTLHQEAPHHASSYQAAPHQGTQHQETAHQAAVQHTEGTPHFHHSFDHNASSHLQNSSSHFSREHQTGSHSNAAQHMTAASHTTHQAMYHQASHPSMHHGNMPASNHPTPPQGANHHTENVSNGTHERTGGSANGVYPPGPNGAGHSTHDEHTSSEEVHHVGQQQYAVPSTAQSPYQQVHPGDAQHAGQYTHAAAPYGHIPPQQAVPQYQESQDRHRSRNGSNMQSGRGRLFA